MSLEECKNECNNYTNCYGVEHDIASNKCYLRKKNDILYSYDINSKKKSKKSNKKYRKSNKNIKGLVLIKRIHHKK